MKRFRLTRKAQADIDAIWLYVAMDSGSEAIADRQVERLHRALVMIASQPKIGLPCPEVDETGLSFPVGKYIVYYRREGSRVVVTHVFRGSRDQKKAWKEEESG